LLNIKSLSFQYPKGTFQLQVPELKLVKGEKVAVIGPSGSGKTTLLNLIAGIYLPDQGSVQLEGRMIHQLNDAARRDFRITRIGFVFQDFQLLDYLTVRDNILYPYRISRVLKLDSSVRQRVESLAEKMGIADKLGRRIHSLSQGEQQRAAICRAMLTNPDLILADEATGNLDPDNKMHILDLLFENVDQNDAGLLAVTHDHELLDRFDRVIDFSSFRFSS
jgi:putative ABC transport system ATP-binding protein